MVGSLILWIVLVPIFGLLVHECAHGSWSARHTGHRAHVDVGRGARLFGFRLGLLDVELRLLAIHDSCKVELTGLSAHVARRVLRAGPMADLGQAALWLAACAAFPGSTWTLLGVAMAFTWWG